MSIQTSNMGQDARTMKALELSPSIEAINMLESVQQRLSSLVNQYNTRLAPICIAEPPAAAGKDSAPSAYWPEYFSHMRDIARSCDAQLDELESLLDRCRL